MAVIQNFNVYDNGNLAGIVVLGRRGMYYAVSCRCDPELSKGKRLILSGERGEIDLGRLYQIGEHFGLETSLAIKKVGEGPCRFMLEDVDSAGRFIELDPSKPFDHFALLEQCRFAVRSGKPGLILPAKK